MPSIGPQLPPGLQQNENQSEFERPTSTQASTAVPRKAQVGPRLPDQQHGPGGDSPDAAPSTSTGSRYSPQAYVHRIHDETRTSSSVARVMGPTLPPPLPKRDRSEAEESENHVSDTGSLEPPPKKARLAEFAPPRVPLDRPSWHPPTIQDSDSDDDYGPTSYHVDGPKVDKRDDDAMSKRGGQNWEKYNLPEASDATPKKRDDWMLMPPAADDLAAHMDPTKVRARKFNSKATRSGGTSESWTETPEEKRRRLEDQVLGVSIPAGQKAKAESRPSSSRDRDSAVRPKKKSGPSLYNLHKSERQTGDRAVEDDPTARGFDWEKDMNIGGKVTHKQKRDLLNTAKNYGGRFSKASS